MKRADFVFLANRLKRATGLSLDEGRAALIESRLKPLAARYGFPTVAALIREWRQGNEGLARAIAEAVVIRDTAFFRDPPVFAALRERVLPSLHETCAGRRRLRIWSAAAATGEEPYSLAMILDSLPQFAGWEIELLATDASSDAIARAREGLYTAAQVQRGLPVRLLARYFRREGDNFRIVERIRARVRFDVFNLLDSFRGLGTFDLILCRNVLMYFDGPTKAQILGKLGSALAAQRYLVIGIAETIHGLNSGLKLFEHGRGIHVKARAPVLCMAEMG